MSDESNCFVGVIFVRYLPDGTPQFLLQPSRWKEQLWKPAIHKFPGGMHKKTDANFLETARREARTETGLKIKKSAKPVLLSPFKIDDQWKYFYLVREREYRGRLRRKVSEDGDTILEIPQWKTFEETRELLHWTHSPVLPDLPKAA